VVASKQDMKIFTKIFNASDDISFGFSSSKFCGMSDDGSIIIVVTY